MKRIMAVLAACAAVLSLTGCAKKEKIVGTWKIDWILVQPEQNGESDYADRETNASLFESEQSYYKFNQDGTAVHHMEDGGGAMDVKGTWTKDADGNYYLFCHPTDVRIVRADNDGIQAFEDLSGKRTANSAGSTYAQLAESYGATTDTVSTLAQTLDLVLAGRVDATLNAELSFYDYMKEHPDAPLKIAALSAEASEVAIPVRKGAENASFLAALDAAIQQLRADGTLKGISEKYFQTDITAINE